ncbi:hypothetical protein A4G17_08240 [Frederiksenia canicola]|uniref:Uncharacterized protein n=2 Tax=Frederiksenia canicola TaxID=123824 RepID=A0AAE7C2T6_9PAST|nr:hypothetical protein A4G17_08240 [Frederiksenia canicola]RPE96127.1 hypothetical protein EDC49_0511 [Frederiksenia canicola]
MKKWALLFGVLSCSTVSAEAVENVDQAVDMVVKSVQKNELLPIPLECVFFIEDESDLTLPYYSVSVFEKHNEKCGGDPATAPKLMNYQINKHTGELCTDSVVWAKKQKVEDPYEPECRAIQ